MNEETFFIVLIVLILGGPIVGYSVEQYNKSQVQIACYKAAEKNPNLTCEKKEQNANK